MATSPRQRSLVIATTTPATINAFVAPQLRGFRARGWAAHIICGEGDLNPEVRELISSSRVVPMTRTLSRLRDLRAVVVTLKELRRIDPDVVLASTPKAALLTLLAARLAGVRVRVFHVRGARWEGAKGLSKQVLLLADRLTAACSTHVLAVSPSLAQLMMASGVTKEPPVVLGHGGSKGVDLSLFRPDNLYSFDPRTPRLGWVGRLSADKGLDAALIAFRRFRATFPGATLEVIGDVDGAQEIDRSTLHRLAADRHIRWIRTLTPEDLARHMAQWDLLLFTSRREGLPNAIIEAAACGVPAVGWRVTGVCDAIDDGVSGFLVSPWDMDGYLSAIRRAVDPNLHQELRRGAQAFAQGFDSRALLKLLLEYLERLDRPFDFVQVHGRQANA